MRCPGLAKEGRRSRWLVAMSFFAVVLGAVRVEAQRTPAPPVPLRDPSPVKPKPDDDFIKLDPLVEPEAGPTRPVKPLPRPAATPAAVEPFPAKPVPSAATQLPPVPVSGGIAKPRDIRPSSFQEITPNETTLAELQQKLGEPQDQRREENATIYSYKVGPFPKVEFVVTDKVVSSIIVRLQAPVAAADIAKELSLEPFTAVPIPDEHGKMLGQAYPERGVLFAFTEDPQKLLVREIVLEPINAEAFILRALYEQNFRYTQILQDLDTAAQYDTRDPRLHWLRARTLHTLRQHTAAVASAREAVRLAPDDPRGRIVLMQSLGELGEHAAALEEARALEQRADLDEVTQARLHCVLGDLLSSGAAPDYKEALRHHGEAIQLASALAADDRFAVRREAKRVLIDAHVGTAIDVAWGHWQRKSDVVPKWLRTARELADAAMESDRGVDDLRLTVLRRSLEAYSGVEGGIDIATLVQELSTEGHRLIGTIPDPRFQARVHWDLAEGLFDACRIENERGQHATALKHATIALSHADRSLEKREPTMNENHFLGRLCFTVGTIHALSQKDHKQALQWYEKALPKLQNGTPADAARNGQRLVSIGVSYWQTGDRERAVKVTKQGIDLVEQAVKESLLDETTLAVPLRNLATMQRQLGNKDEAEALTAAAEKLQKSGEKKR